MTKSLYSIWHLNLLYSSIEVERRSEVIAKCFWPLLDIAKHGIKIGVEIPAYSLEITNEIDSTWVLEFKKLIADDKIELIGSGYTQIIAPITPYKINKTNIEEGFKVYQNLLGCAPDVWLVNEQAYSDSLISLYKSFDKIKAIVIDWSAIYGNNPDLSESLAYCAQKLTSSSGISLPVIWNNSIAFQKFQHLVHKQIRENEYFEYIEKISCNMRASGHENSTFCIYGNDAEIFDFRPGRFHTEATVTSVNSEWDTISEIFGKLSKLGFDFILPRDSLQYSKNPLSITTNTLTEPVSVKKQPKYNVTRWALAGRSTPLINQYCFDLFGTLPERELCYFLSSDFRTHITEKRWHEFYGKLYELHQTIEKENRQEINGYSPSLENNFSNNTLYLQLNPLKGMTIENLGIKDYPPLFGKVSHGYFSRMDLCVDWYSGNTVFQPPGKSQAADLNPTEILFGNGSFKCINKFLDGVIEKIIEFGDDNSSIEVTYNFKLSALPIGSLRFGYITFHPAEIETSTFELSSHAGGDEPSIYSLPSREFNHAENPNNVVSANNLIPMTENYFLLSTKSYILRVELIESTHYPSLMAKFKKAKEGNLLRLFFSLSEYDETRKAPWDYQNIKIRLKYTFNVRPK